MSSLALNWPEETAGEPRGREEREREREGPRSREGRLSPLCREASCTWLIIVKQMGRWVLFVALQEWGIAEGRALPTVQLQLGFGFERAFFSLCMRQARFPISGGCF